MPQLRSRMQRVYTETPFWLETANVPGVTIALLENGKTCGVYYFGSTNSPHAIPGNLSKEAQDASNTEPCIPVTEDTIFPAASLSKQALLYAALEVIEMGALDLDRPLAEYLSKPYGMDDPLIGLITARHVLSHTTGWINWPAKDKPIERLARPGERWGYSGEGYLFLQEALASILNESPIDYTRRLVLDPLGMEKSSFVWREEYDRTATNAYYPGGLKADTWKVTDVNGAASLHTTARDYALLLEAYLTPELRARHPYVYISQIKMTERIGWTVGWGSADDALWQWGQNDGVKAFAALRPDRGLGIVCLTNSARGQRINKEWTNAWLEIDLPAFYFRSVEL